MKKRYKKQRLVSEINITPFTDVILVLLVIFMITTPLISESNIKLKLPQAKGGKPVEVQSKQQQFTISITSEGPIYLNEQMVTKKELIQKLKISVKENPDLTVVLRSDRLVQFKDIVSVLDPLTELGITKFNIAATSEP